jgi:uncharacterized lipoprotein YajG
MNENKKLVGSILGVLFILSMVASCATIPELRVEYRVPNQKDTFKGKEVSLAFEDIRENKEILGPGARNDFKGFTGNITLSLAYGTEKGFRMGLYDLQSLFMEVFKKRFEVEGIKVVSEGNIAQEKIIIVLKELTLDLDNRKWIAKMSYEARLMRDNRMVVKQTISGQTDHAKIIGRVQADKVMGELFTDLINRMDPVKLLQGTD